jgi:hypothetical protein
VIKRGSFRPQVTRLRLLRGGWGRFTEEIVTFGDPDPLERVEPGVRVVELDEILDLDDEDAETGLPYGRERPN